MASTVRSSTWEEIQELRKRLERAIAQAPTIEAAAQHFATGFAAAFETVALARMFLVVPAHQLPTRERTWAERFAQAANRRVAETTPVLALVGTAGIEPAWNDRRRSVGHCAIPLIDKELIEGAPMIAELLASLRIELVGLSTDAPAQLRSLPGGLNARFFVPDARTTVDASGRHVIAARDFVSQYEIASVFGMGGVYVGGELAVAIIFTREVLSAIEVDRFPTFISAFKMTTSRLMTEGKIFETT
jgi:hypothetical protein